MERLIKSRVLSFILGAVIFGTIGSVIAYSYSAKQISFTPSDSSWKKQDGSNITNVNDAINELSTMKNELQSYKNKYDSITITFQGQGYSNVAAYGHGGLSFNNVIKNYKYFKITSNYFINSNTKSCELHGWNGTTTDLNIDTEYNVSDYTAISVYATSIAANAWSTCTVSVQFYN